MSKSSSKYRSATIKIFGNRVKELREQKKMTQVQMAEEFALFAESAPVQAMTISSWEQGLKMCTAETLKYLALFFGVSTDYLLGITDDPERDYRAISELDLVSPDAQIISYNELPSVDGMPVVIESNTNAFSPRWAIYDNNNHRFVTKTGILNYRPDLRVRSSVPFSSVTMDILKKSMLSIRQMKAEEHFWIVKIDGTEEEKIKYTGWYHHNEDKSCIINEKGLTLPYAGIGISYNAFSDEIKLY